MEPKFVVCDEPISALDVSVQAQIVRLLGELKASLGLTMLFIAHDLSMVRYVSDRMAVMYWARWSRSAPPTTCTSGRSIPYTQILVASNPQPDPRTERNRARDRDQGRDRLADQRRSGCRFAARCPKVMDVCRSVTPQLKAVADGGAAAGRLPSLQRAELGARDSRQTRRRNSRPGIVARNSRSCRSGRPLATGCDTRRLPSRRVLAKMRAVEKGIS